VAGLRRNGWQVWSGFLNTEETENDPTAHAEINVIKKAAKKLGKNLENCILLSTHEPCPMCATAMIWANIRKLVYGYSIEESIRQGKNRIEIKCKDIFEKAKIKIEIIENILFDDCSLLYNKEIRKEIKKLRNSTDDQLVIYNEKMCIKRKEWYNTKKHLLNEKINDNKEKAYKLLLKKFGTSEEQIPIIEKTINKIIFHSMNFCPTLEACKILDLDTRHICKLYNEQATDALIKQVDPNLKFTRNYERIRPYSEYCEEIIIDERNN
jgi:tRNA(Arg) A34 adenosine deaminase TadA